jgi:hypothetical protein
VSRVDELSGSDDTPNLLMAQAYVTAGDVICRFKATVAGGGYAG